MEARINYVMVSYAGPRRKFKPDAYYLIKHIEYLQMYKHNLAQITIILNKSDTPNDTPALELIEKTPLIQNTPLVFFYKHNDGGISYGRYSEMFDLYKSIFDYYIFIEDDYVFVQDNFDDIMVDMYSSYDNCGYLCAKTGGAGKGLHGSNSNGMASSRALIDTAHRFNGKIPYTKAMWNGPNFPDTINGQVVFTRSFIEAGYDIYDITSRYLSPFYSSVYGTIQELSANNHSDYLMKPIQMIDGDL